MKKHIIILAAFFAAALLVPGCNPEYTPGLGSQELKISLFCDEPETKADPDPDPFAFESTIEHFDFFFFKDAAGTQPIPGMHERVTGSEKVLDTREGSNYSALRKGTSYVYILANYPGTIDHTTDHTLAELLALPVDDPIVTAKEKKLNPITGDMEETGNVTYCSSLVMDSYQKATDTDPETYTTKLTPQAIEEVRTVTIRLSRLAAKLALIINVAESVPGSMTYTDASGKRQEEWTPVLKDLHAYFVNALNNKATVDAEPIQRSMIPAEDVDSYDYLTYPTRYPLTPDASNKYKVTSAPAYTYPQEWVDTANGEPYFKIQIPWESSLRGSSTFYYKVALPKSDNHKRTLNRNMLYQVTVNLSVIDTENEYVELNGSYVVTPWLPSFGMGKYDPGSAKFFDVPVKTFEVYSQKDFKIPFYSSSTVNAYFTKIEYSHYKDGAGKTYTFSFDDKTHTSFTVPDRYDGAAFNPPIARDVNPYSLTVEGNNVKFEHALTDVYTVRNVTMVIENAEGRSAAVVIKQHPAIEVKSRLAGTVFVNGHFARALESVHVYGDPTKKLGKPFVLKYNPGQGQTRYHSDDQAFTGTTYGGSDTYWYYPGESYSGSESNSPLIIRNVDYGRYGYIEGDCNRGSNLYMVEVVVSAFDDSNNQYRYQEDDVMQDAKYFRLGDPRVKANYGSNNRFDVLATVPNKATNRTGGGYLYQSSTVRDASNNETTGAAVYKAWKQPGEIMISKTSKENGNLISPHFILSSFFNAQPNSLTYANCLKRAATYQEAGFPAGRWRLPTEAEIAFMVQQQQKGVLPVVWASGSKYWCADGRYVVVSSSGEVVSFYNTTDTDTKVNRFVYDLWYWGDQPMNDAEQYWPNGHLAKPNDTTGSTFPSID